MTLPEYFEQAKGVGVLATTDGAGQVNQAVYAKPLFLDNNDEQMCYFVMANRLTHDNVQHNPSASNLFIEHGEGNAGKRLSLIVGNVESDVEKVKAIRRSYNLPITDEECQYLVQFHIEGVRPLIGNE